MLKEAWCYNLLLGVDSQAAIKSSGIRMLSLPVPVQKVLSFSTGLNSGDCMCSESCPSYLFLIIIMDSDDSFLSVWTDR